MARRDSALETEKLGGNATLDQVEAILRLAADDIGKPGTTSSGTAE